MAEAYEIIKEKCINCDGNGKGVTESILCVKCNGDGIEIRYFGGTKTCRTCFGEKTIPITHPCNSCGGTGCKVSIK